MLDSYFNSFAAYLRTGQQQHLTSVFPEAPKLDVAAVYRNGFLRSCVEALRASYPVVDKIVGAEYFDQLAREYVELRPPDRATLIAYGDDFPEFVKQCSEQHRLTYLEDIARLDRAWLAVFFAGDPVSYTADDIEQLQACGRDISELSVRLPRSACLLSLCTSVTDVWTRIKSDERVEHNTRLDTRSERTLVWRDTQDLIHARALSPAEHAFLAALDRGCILHFAASQAYALDDDFPVVELFSLLLDAGLISKNKQSN